VTKDSVFESIQLEGYPNMPNQPEDYSIASSSEILTGSQPYPVSGPQHRGTAQPTLQTSSSLSAIAAEFPQTTDKTKLTVFKDVLDQLKVHPKMPKGLEIDFS